MINQFIPAPAMDKEIYGHIALFRDNEDPYTFYYLNSRPRVSIDKTTKKPTFDYMVIGRNFKKDGDQHIQEGRLVMSVNLALTDAEMAAVKSTIKKYLDGNDFNKDKIYYPKYDFIRNTTRTKQATISSINFNSGRTSINLASSSYDGKFTHETKPTLFGDNNATIAANLDSQESQILYEIFKPNKKTDKSVNLSAIVNYEMKYNTIIPFKATVTIHYSRIYKELQELQRSHCGLDSKYRGSYSLPELGKCFYSHGADLYVSKENLNNYLKNSDNTNQKITIKIDDLSNDSKNEKYEELILSTLQSQLTEKVCDKLFEKVDPVSIKDDKSTHYDVGTTGSKGSDASSSSKGSDASSSSKRNVLFDVCYKLSNNIETTVTNDFTMTIDKAKVVETEANSNASLELLLDKFSIDSMVRELDASNLYFQEMIVPISVDNSNFDRDIAMISVRVIYKDKSGKVKMDQIFHFDQENPDTKTFRVIMDRDNSGQLIGKFYYQTRIRYRGFDVYGKNVNENDKWTRQKEVNGSTDKIYVPYSDMRNLCVNCEAGDVAWDIIQKMAIEFKYKDDPQKNGASKLMILTEANPSDTWNCFMYNENSDSYLYRIHYFYQDGTDDWSKEYEGNSKSKQLIINDKLSGVYRTKFEINFKKSIERVKVFVRCQGKEEDSGWIYQPDTWIWQTRLKEDGKMSYQYKYQYYLVNGDDSIQGTDWTAPIAMNTDSNQQTVTIDLRINQISLIIDGESIDWNKWSRVYLHFRYDDDANNLHYDDEKIPPIKLSPNKNETNVVIPVINEAIRPTIFAEYIPQVGDEVIPSEERTAGRIVILPNAAPPKYNTPEPSTPEKSTSSAPSAEGSPKIQETASNSTSAPVAKDINLTFSTKSMDWEKWMNLWVHIKYDDDVNSIHINDQNQPPFKMKPGCDDKTVSFKIKDPKIQPTITIDYMSESGDIISSNPTPITGPKVNLPNDVPPNE